MDTEPDGQPNATLTGDGADEDGVTFPSPLIPGHPAFVQIRTGATGGFVSCWIDFNRNGSWADPGDQVLTDVPLGANASVYQQFPVPAGLTEGQDRGPAAASAHRLGSSFTGGAADGEVEDHPATISLIEIPTLDTWGLLALAALLGLMAVWRMRRPAVK